MSSHRVVPLPEGFVDGQLVDAANTALGIVGIDAPYTGPLIGRLVAAFPLSDVLVPDWGPDPSDLEYGPAHSLGGCPRYDPDRYNFCSSGCKVEAFRSMMRAGFVFPPVVVLVERWPDGSGGEEVSWTGDDGAHRRSAWRQEGYTHGPAVIFSSKGPDDPEVPQLLAAAG